MNQRYDLQGLGRLYGVGVGPGDPELLTLRALRVVQEVAVVCASGAGEESYALDVVEPNLDRSRQEVLLVEPACGEGAESTEAWREAMDAIAARLLEGRSVAFVTEGDPLLYSSFSYVLDGIASSYPDVPVEIVPGVSSVMAAAARAGVSLATQGQRLAILPAVYGIDDLREAITHYDAIVLMTVDRTLLHGLANLEKLGLAGRPIYVRRATTPSEQVVRDLHQLSDEDLDYFSLLIIRR